MPNYFEKDGDYQSVGGGGGYGGGGYGGGGFGGGGSGSWCIIIVFLVICWLLFRQDRNDCNGGGNNYGGGYGMPYPYPYPPYFGGGKDCCSPLDCKIPMTPDMSNCELDRDIWKVDADLLKCCCEEKEAIHHEGESTRALIQSNYLQDLRDKLADKNCEVQALKTQQYTDAKFDALNAKLCKEDHETDKQFYKTYAMIEKLDCKIPDRRPIYCDGVTPVTRDIDCHDFPRRRGCCEDSCCA